jgi:peptidoglycan-associated lipoprotein
MRIKFAVTLGLAAIFVAAACGGGQPEPVTPVINQDSIDAARRDSIAREQARLDSIARARARAEEEARLAREEAARREAAITAEVRTLLAERIHFDFDKSVIRPGTDTEVLQRKLQILQANSAVVLEITGHCDERGSDEYNMALGNRRALAAKQWLVDRGIAATRVTTRSMGEETPVNPASTEAAWTENRRDEFAITGGGDRLVRPAGMM